MKKVKITNAPIPKSGVEIGDIFEVKDYEFDPQGKYVLIEKIEGSVSFYSPSSVSFYKEDCEILIEIKSLDVGLLIQKTQFQSEIQKDAKDTGVSQADLIEISYMEMKLRKKELFVICPKCDSLYYPYSLLNIEGMMKCKCKNCSHEFEEEITN